MGQHAKTTETFPTETRQQGQIENILTADSSQSTEGIKPDIKKLTAQALEARRAELLELESMSINYTFTREEQQRLYALSLGQQNVSYLKESYGEQAISNRSADGTIQQKYIKTTVTTVGNFDGVNRMQIESERVVIDPTGTFSSQGKNTYTPTTQKVGNAGL